MKTETLPKTPVTTPIGSKTAPVPAPPNESDIRDYAFHLYTFGNGEPGHDLDHWLEAEVFLKSRAKTA